MRTMHMQRTISILAAGLLAAVVGCSGKARVEIIDDDGGSGGSSNGGSGGMGGTGGSGNAPGQPVGPPSDGSPGDGPGFTYAIDRFFLGDTDTTGIPSASAWRQFGYNLDGLVSTKDSTDLCQPVGNAPPSNVYPDGDAGIDNAWGKLLLPTIAGLTMSPSDAATEYVLDGRGANLISIDMLGMQSNYLGLSGQIVYGADLGMPPLLDGNDVWPVTSWSLADPPAVGSALVELGGSYVNNNTWVSGAQQSITIFIPLDQVLLPLRMENAVITMTLSPDRMQATNGVIAGLIDAEVLVDDLRVVAGQFDPSLCTGPTFEGFANQIRQSSDMLMGAQDPAQSCTSISVGIGFTATAVSLGTSVDTPPPPDPCEP